MSHWIAEAVKAGLEELDVDEVLQQAAAHVTTKGEWEKGVISPSLVAKTCRLQRLKAFLGHQPRPKAEPFMGMRAGVPDAVSVINMARGFFAEGIMVAALKQSLGERVLAHAPTYAPRFTDPQTGMTMAGHPDMLLFGDYDDVELIQFKSPSVFKLDRIEQYGVQDALKTYQAQLATEFYIVRNAPNCGLTFTPGVIPPKGWPAPPVRNNLVLFTWEGTPKNSHPRIIVVPLEWDESLASIPLAIADEIEEDVIRARDMGIWPDAFPEHQYDVWPCSYCSFSRLGDYTDPANVLPKCDDHKAWEKN